MTTPERLRRRQIRNDWFIAIVAVALVAGALFFNARDKAQRECLATYISVNSKTSAIRSKLVERESAATRDIILNGTASETKAEFQRVRALYARTLEDIDKAREANPVEPLPKGVCD